LPSSNKKEEKIMKTVIGLFDRVDKARECVQTLLDRGIGHDNINFVIINSDEKDEGDGRRTRQTNVPLRVCQNVAGALKNIGVSEGKALCYAEAIWRGDVMVLVRAQDNMVKSVKNSIRTFGRIDEEESPAGNLEMLDSPFELETDLDTRIYTPGEVELSSGLGGRTNKTFMSVEEPVEDMRPQDVEPVAQNLTPQVKAVRVDLSTKSNLSTKGEILEAMNRPTYTIPGDLKKLDDIGGFEIADNEPNPRTWDLIGREGEIVGTITYLLASPTTQKVYFAVIDRGSLSNDKLYVIPLTSIKFDLDQQKAYAPFSQEDFSKAPKYSEGEPDYENHFNYWSSRDKGEMNRFKAKGAGA
jgi:hypothetical protein